MGLFGKQKEFKLKGRALIPDVLAALRPRGAGSREQSRIAVFGDVHANLEALNAVLTDALVELIDMYPTLCELAGLEQPSHLEGCSFVPVLKNPSRDWKTAAFSQFPTPALREWGSIALRPAMRETYFGPLADEMEKRIQDQLPGQWNRKLFEEDLTGYAMRTDRYRLIAWKDSKNMDAKPIFIELYDHKTDPLETKNIAKQHPELVASLLAQFSKGWKGALPKP